jgi:hypothetical protein
MDGGSARRKAQTQNKRTHTSKPQVGFEPTIPVFERAKTVHAVDRSATDRPRQPTLAVNILSADSCVSGSWLLGN